MVAREGKIFYEQIMEKLFVEDCGKKTDFARKLIAVIKAKFLNLNVYQKVWISKGSLGQKRFNN